MKYKLSPSCGPRRGLGYMKICDYLSKSWAMETLLFTRERALCTMCFYLPLVYTQYEKKAKKKNCYGRYSAYDRRSRCLLGEHQRITSLPQSKPRRRLQSKSLPRTPIAGWFLLKCCWPGDWVVFYLVASIGSFTGVPCKPSVDQVHLPTTFRLNRLNWPCTEDVSVVQEISCVLFRSYYS